MSPPISKADANAIYDILKEECGATEFWREDFVRSGADITEYRFQGVLGFGGKFWNTNDRWYVTCYSEDETPERRGVMDAANKRLAALKEKK